MNPYIRWNARGNSAALWQRYYTRGQRWRAALRVLRAFKHAGMVADVSFVDGIQ